mmetsp:Transcript_139139/g.388168  ORF Transcript_139139/g.388168 Transcript_139139/m.388168 type:complete len:218 (+) Transcript_139139:646-1299(+)
MDPRNQRSSTQKWGGECLLSMSCAAHCRTASAKAEVVPASSPPPPSALMESTSLPLRSFARRLGSAGALDARVARAPESHRRLAFLSSSSCRLWALSAATNPLPRKTPTFSQVAVRPTFSRSATHHSARLCGAGTAASSASAYVTLPSSPKLITPRCASSSQRLAASVRNTTKAWEQSQRAHCRQCHDRRLSCPTARIKARACSAAAAAMSEGGPRS